MAFTLNSEAHVDPILVFASGGEMYSTDYR